MKDRKKFISFYLLAGILLAPLRAYPAFELAPSTGEELPYSVQSKNLLNRLFHNRTVIGGQVIALRGEHGKDFSGNYIDVGALGGVKKNDVFALFVPSGDPVGFVRVTEVQRYTSAFEFMELTVKASEDLVAKKVTQEIQNRLPERLFHSPDMRRWHQGVSLAMRKKRATPPSALTTAGSGSSLPPLPGQSTSLPPLPGMPNSASAPVPVESQTNAPGLPPLPAGGASSAESALPPLPSDSGNALPPISTEPGQPNPIPTPPSSSVTGGAANANSGLPPLPGMDNAPAPNAPDSGLPALPAPSAPSASPAGDNGLPPLPGDNPTNPGTNLIPPSSQLPGLPGDGLALPFAPPNASEAALPDGLPALPGMDSPALPGSVFAQIPAQDDSLPPLGNGLPPLPDGGMLPDPMMAMGSLPDNSLPPLEAGLPALPASPDQMASNPPSIDAGLPPIDNGSMPAMPAMDTASMPPSLAGGLPPVLDPGLGDVPPSDLAATELPASVAAQSPSSNGIPSVPTDNVAAGLAVSHSSELGLPSVPAKVNSDFSQDIPTLSSGHKPAA